MKKLLTFFTMALLAFSVGGAATYSHTFKPADSWGTSIPQIVTLSNIDWTLDGTCNNGLYLGSVDANKGKQFGSGSKPFTELSLSTTGIAGTITSITVNASTASSASATLSVTVGGSSFISGRSLTTTATDYTGTGSASGEVVISITQTTSKALYIKSISITYTPGGSTVAAPTISPAGGNFLTTQEVTLSHADGGTIYYTLDGTTPTTSSTLYSAPFTINATTTVKAIAVKNGESSSVASATFTKTGVATVAEALALAQGTTFTFTGNAVVTYQNGRYVWIRDNNRDSNNSGLIYRNSNDTGTFDNGDILDANWTATRSVYNNNPQFTNPSGVASSNNGGTVAPYDKTSTGVTSANVNEYVSFSSITPAWDSDLGYCYVTFGNNKVYFRNTFFTYINNGLTVTSGHTYNIEGIVYVDSNNNVYVYMTSVTEVITGDPLLEVNPLTLNFNDSGTGNTFTVEGSNLGGDNVGVTQSNGNFSSSLTATTGWPTNGDSFWYFSPDNGSVNGTVAMYYNGRELSASETVTLGNNSGASATVAVNYRSDVYILGNYGSGWDYSNGILMTYDATNNTYTASVTASDGNLIVFARKLGLSESSFWNTRYAFGPNSTGDCWVSGDFTGTIDLNDDDPIYFNSAGTYIIEINATTGALTITKEVVNTGDFELVTNVSDLNAGDEVIFVNSGTAGSALAMSTTQNSNNRGTTDVTVSTTFKVTADDPVQIATLEASGDGNWYFNVGNGYLYAASSSGNQLKTQSTTSDNAKARITIGSGNVANIVFQGSNTRNTMQFNGTIVSCYGSASQSPVYLYKRGGSTEPSIAVNPTSLALVIPADGNSVDGTVTVTETNTTGTTSVSISGTGASHFTATLNNGTLTVTYSGTATQANPDQATITLTNGTATATVTVTGYKRVQASGTLYNKVTSADQIQDGLQYILVYEGTPEAINDITTSTGGTGAAVIWETQGSVVNIDNTDVIEFTLEGNATSAKFHHGDLYLGRSGNNGLDDNSETVWMILENTASDNDPGGFYLAVGTASNAYRLRYNTGMGGNDKFRCYSNNTGAPVYLYVQGGAAGVATPVISPASGNYAEDQEVTITCGTTGATIYYTINGGDTQTYSEPFNVDVDEEHTSTTIVAWAVKDNVTSEQATVTYTYKNLYVNSIEEFLALADGDSAIFKNPVVVLFDYSQNSGSGQEYIWVKDRTGYTQFFIAPQFDAESVADPQYNGTYGQFVPKYENGDVIPAGFKVKKAHYSTGDYYQGQCYATHSSFQAATDKALADPEQVTLSELLANPAAYNNRYLFINKLQVNYSGTGLSFTISADEDGDGTAEVEGGNSVVGYNKYNSPAWKDKDGNEIGVTLPEDNNYYNVKFIFQKWSGGYEIMPIEFTPWEDTSLRLEDLVEVGVENNTYTISNQLQAAAVTWDADHNMFAIFAKDDQAYASKRYPAADQETYLIRYENGTFINEVEQENYDQSNWIEILIPSGITNKTAVDINVYNDTLHALQGKYVNQILNAGSIRGTYVNVLNPTILVTNRPTVASASAYEPNIYCTANFLTENLDADGAQGNDGNYFMMDAKPHEFCKVVWCWYDSDNGNYFVIPAREGNVVNGHNFHGSFMANMSLCEDYQVYQNLDVISAWFLDSDDESYNGQQTLYGFNAIVRKNPNYSNPANGAPRRIQEGTGDIEQTPAYIVYPLNAGDNSSDNVVSVKEILGNKAIESVHYYNTMGMESKTPFEGINIVVTRYTDGSTSTIKVMK